MAACLACVDSLKRRLWHQLCAVAHTRPLSTFDCKILCTPGFSFRHTAMSFGGRFWGNVSRFGTDGDDSSGDSLLLGCDLLRTNDDATLQRSAGAPTLPLFPCPHTPSFARRRTTCCPPRSVTSTSRPWYLEGDARRLRQTTILAAHQAAELTALLLFHRRRLRPHHRHRHRHHLSSLHRHPCRRTVLQSIRTLQKAHMMLKHAKTRLSMRGRLLGIQCCKRTTT